MYFETGRSTGPWWSDATARAGYAMTTTTTTFNVIQGQYEFCTNWKRVCDFLLVRRSNIGPLLPCFKDAADKMWSMNNYELQFLSIMWSLCEP